jgi:hypothetical protein
LTLNDITTTSGDFVAGTILKPGEFVDTTQQGYSASYIPYGVKVQVATTDTKGGNAMTFITPSIFYFYLTVY